MTIWRVAVVAALTLLGTAAVWRLAAPPIPHGIIERTAP